MSLFPNSRIIISFGSLSITWYAVLILTGALVGYSIAQRTMRKWGYGTDILEDYIVPMLVLSILGARVYYVIFNWDYYSIYPSEIFAIWNGGLAIHGGLFVGFIFSYFYFKHKKVSFLRMFDLLMPSVALAQAFGRWGNFANQEAYGQIVSESFYNHWPSFIKDQMYIYGQYRQPTFLYESVCDLCCFLFIYFVYRKHGYRRRGDCGFVYLVWYGASRFVIEGFRSDSLMLGLLKMAQIVSIGFMVVGILGLFGVFHRKKKPILLFDLDGTLVDTKKLIFATFKEVIEKYDPSIQLSDEDYYQFLGPTLEHSFGLYFPEEKIPDLIEQYQRVNLRLHDTYIEPIDGVKETLDTLKQQGYRMAVVSNKRHKVVERGLKVSKLESYFELVLAKEELPESKPDPSGLLMACGEMHLGHDDVVYVGDNPSDVKAAQNMAAYSVGFTPDDFQKKRLRESNPCVMLETFDELLDVLNQDVPWCDIRIW